MKGAEYYAALERAVDQKLEENADGELELSMKFGITNKIKSVFGFGSDRNAPYSFKARDVVKKRRDDALLDLKRHTQSEAEFVEAEKRFREKEENDINQESIDTLVEIAGDGDLRKFMEFYRITGRVEQGLIVEELVKQFKSISDDRVVNLIIAAASLDDPKTCTLLEVVNALASRSTCHELMKELNKRGPDILTKLIDIDGMTDKQFVEAVDPAFWAVCFSTPCEPMIKWLIDSCKLFIGCETVTQLINRTDFAKLFGVLVNDYINNEFVAIMGTKSFDDPSTFTISPTAPDSRGKINLLQVFTDHGILGGKGLVLADYPNEINDKLRDVFTSLNAHTAIISTPRSILNPFGPTETLTRHAKFVLDCIVYLGSVFSAITKDYVSGVMQNAETQWLPKVKNCSVLIEYTLLRAFINDKLFVYYGLFPK